MKEQILEERKYLAEKLVYLNARFGNSEFTTGELNLIYNIVGDARVSEIREEVKNARTAETGSSY